jgi:CBS domain containing-hemolysin-like protein
MKNVLAMHEVRVAHVMVPRADIFSVSLEMTLAEVLAMFRTAGHSRLPAYGTSLDDPRGMVHVRDLLDYIADAETPIPRDEIEPGPSEGREASRDKMVRSLGALDLSLPLSAAKILRPVLFVPPSMPALDLLVKMQATRTHMALVIDEYGGTEGLASIEDIVEMIVGDIEDEHDADEKPLLEKGTDGTFIADARTSLEELSEKLGTNLDEMTDAEDVETVGGLVTALAGHVPVRGEIVSQGEIEFEVLDADPRRIKRLKIHRRPASAPAPASMP